MEKRPYAKPALNFQEQLELLQSRGLKISDEAQAIHLLSKISYYRFSAYWHPLLADKENHVFKPDATFEKAFQLYCFDRELRQMIATELEKIEVAVRTQIIYHLSHAHGPAWITESQLFTDIVMYAKKSVLN